MDKKTRYGIYALFISIYIVMSAYNYAKSSQWLFDNLIAIAFLTFFFAIIRWLKVGLTGFIMFNIALLLHNLGTFGFYAWTWGPFAYDNLTHFIGSLVAGYIVFNFVARKLHLKKNAIVKDTVIDEHKAVTIFLVIASVAMFGVFVELIEFGGFMFLGQGEGMLFTGSGDAASSEDMAGQYIDTMSDIVVNTLGTLAGVLIYYYANYKKKPWMKY